MATLELCPLCDRKPSKVVEYPRRQTFHVDCSTCGRFEITEEKIEDGWLLADDVRLRRHLLSALVKGNRERVVIDLRTIERLRNGQIAERTVSEKIELVVRFYADQSPEIGHFCLTDPSKDYPAAWCRSPAEWKAIVDVLDSDFGHLEYENPEGKRVRVTIKGWQWLAEQPKAKGDVGFIAMAFDPSLDDVKAAIEQGVRSAGYRPVRIDQDHYIGGVMDRILATIRDSRFVVADFKLNRGGVYYEAGFAAGRGIPVFCLCEEGQTNPKSEERVHFDVAHLNILNWDKKDLAGLSTRLRDRIVAVLGKGPVAP